MARLSKREEEVLSLIGQSLRGKQIAQALGISEFTVRKHRASIMRKLDLRSAAQLIATAAKMARGPEPPQPGAFRARGESAAAA